MKKFHNLADCFASSKAFRKTFAWECYKPGNYEHYFENKEVAKDMKQRKYSLRILSSIINYDST